MNAVDLRTYVWKKIDGDMQMKMRFVIMLAVAGACLVVLAGCSASGGPSEEKQLTGKSIEVSYDELSAARHVQREIELRQDGSVEVTLFSNPSTGYSWSENAAIENAAIVQQVSHQHVQPVNTAVVGAGGAEIWVFRAVNSGETKISLRYGQPWPGGESGLWSFDLTVNVK